MTSVEDAIEEGIAFIVRNLSDAGGVPAVAPGDAPGVWTTAESLESILSSARLSGTILLAIQRMVRFLLDAQLADGSGQGGWPLVSAGQHASTMATAECVLALNGARSILSQEVRVRVDLAVKAGRAWLVANQDSRTGGWGVEPQAGHNGSEPRMLATFLALRALAGVGESLDKSRSVRRGVDFVWSLYDGSGGFSSAAGRLPDVCSSARAAWALLTTGAEGERRDFKRDVQCYVRSKRPVQALWPLDTETYIPDGSPGQVVFNSNTTAELLQFFVMMGEIGDESTELVLWFMKNQRADGAWPLGSNNVMHEDVLTWSTNEAVMALAEYSKKRGVPQPTPAPTPIPSKASRPPWLVVWILVTVVIGESLILMGSKAALEKSWESLPNDFKTTLVWSVVIALAVNLVSAFIAFLVGRWWGRKGERDAS